MDIKRHRLIALHVAGSIEAQYPAACGPNQQDAYWRRGEWGTDNRRQNTTDSRSIDVMFNGRLYRKFDGGLNWKREWRFHRRLFVGFDGELSSGFGRRFDSGLKGTWYQNYNHCVSLPKTIASCEINCCK